MSVVKALSSRYLSFSLGCSSIWKCSGHIAMTWFFDADAIFMNAVAEISAMSIGALGASLSGSFGTLGVPGS